MLELLKEESNKTYTENGAVTYKGTKSYCLDLFSTIGALRSADETEIIKRFIRAYNENPDMAMKILFYARDVRGGIGERRVFRIILKFLALYNKQSLIKNIKYDKEKANNVQYGYVPDPDQTLNDKTGICFDYAYLTCAMLRSQGIPTKLEVGYVGEVYHAWISCYVDETGWIDNIIEFDGKDWSLLDPTLGANNKSKDVKKYIGEGSKYIVKYTY